MAHPLQAARRDPFNSMAGQLSKILDDMVGRTYVQWSDRQTWTPAINEYEASCGYGVCVELAGMRPEQIEVLVDKRRLVIRGHRAIPGPDSLPEHTIQSMEIAHGEFCRVVSLPADVDVDRVESRYRDGLLWICLPRRR